MENHEMDQLTDITKACDSLQSLWLQSCPAPEAVSVRVGLGFPAWLSYPCNHKTVVLGKQRAHPEGLQLWDLAKGRLEVLEIFFGWVVSSGPTPC